MATCRDLAARGMGHIADPFATVYYNGEHFSTQARLTRGSLLSLSLSLCPPPFPLSILHSPCFSYIHTSLSPLNSPSVSTCVCVQVMPKTRFPRWRKTFDLDMCKDRTRPLKIVVFDRDKFLQDKFMGQVRSGQGPLGLRQVSCALVTFCCC